MSLYNDMHQHKQEHHSWFRHLFVFKQQFIQFQCNGSHTELTSHYRRQTTITQSSIDILSISTCMRMIKSIGYSNFHGRTRRNTIHVFVAIQVTNSIGSFNVILIPMQQISQHSDYILPILLIDCSA